MTIREEILAIAAGPGSAQAKRGLIRARRARALHEASQQLTFPWVFERGGLTVRVEGIVRPRPGLIKIQGGRVFNGQGREIPLRHSGWGFARPPILVPDPAGPLDLNAGKVYPPGHPEEGNPLPPRPVREDPLAALEAMVFDTAARLAATPAEPGQPRRLDSTLTVYSDTDDGHVYKFGFSDYSEVLTGPGTAAQDAISFMSAGQGFPGIFTNHLAFLRFDTSAIGSDTVSLAEPGLYGIGDDSDTDFTLRAAVHSWTSPLTTGEYVASGSLPSSNASFDTSGGFSTSGYNTLSDDSLSAAVNGSGDTELLLWSSRYESETEPSGNENVAWSAADEAGTTQDPKLYLEHAAAGGGAETPRLTLLGVG